MSMESNAFLPALRQLPAIDDLAALSSEEIRARIVGMDRGQFATDVSLGVEEAAKALFDARNVPDVLREAYVRAFPDKAEEGISLNAAFRDANEGGSQALTGFVSNLKGKVAELQLKGQLEALNPGWDFELAQNANQPIWDIAGTGPDGQEMLFQVKTGAEDYAADVVDAIQVSPTVWFAVSTEVYDAIASSHPELLEGMIFDIGSNEELTDNVMDGLGTLASNLGVDVPDSLGQALPFVAEIVLGLRLIWQILRTERELSGVDLDDRGRVHGIRTLALMSRYGINQVLIWSGVGVGYTGGTIVPGVGNVAGGIVGGAAGLVGGMALNRALQPRIQELAIKFAGGDADYVFYLMNKAAVDGLAGSFATTNAA